MKKTVKGGERNEGQKEIKMDEKTKKMKNENMKNKRAKGNEMETKKKEGEKGK